MLQKSSVLVFWFCTCLFLHQNMLSEMSQIRSFLLWLPMLELCWGWWTGAFLPCHTWAAYSHEFLISISVVNAMSGSKATLSEFLKQCPDCVQSKICPTRFCVSAMRCPGGGSVEINDLITCCSIADGLLCHWRVFHRVHLSMYLPSGSCHFFNRFSEHATTHWDN